MTNTHTPGPWHLGMKPGPMIYGADGAQVADLRGDLLDKGEALANARLIAAAPDLLAALRHALERFEAIPEHRDEAGIYRNAARIARAAITRATGEA